MGEVLLLNLVAERRMRQGAVCAWVCGGWHGVRRGEGAVWCGEGARRLGEALLFNELSPPPWRDSFHFFW